MGTYSYSGNRLASISGFVDSSYTHNANGNQVSDSQKGIIRAYELGKLSAPNALRILTLGISFGPAPYYGEHPYSGRRIMQGIEAGLQKR